MLWNVCPSSLSPFFNFTHCTSKQKHWYYSENLHDLSCAVFCLVLSECQQFLWHHSDMCTTVFRICHKNILFQNMTSHTSLHFSLCSSGLDSLRMFCAHHLQDEQDAQYALAMPLHTRKVLDVWSHLVKSCASCHVPMVVTSFSLLSTVMEVDLQIVGTPQQPHWILARTEVMLF